MARSAIVRKSPAPPNPTRVHDFYLSQYSAFGFAGTIDVIGNADGSETGVYAVEAEDRALFPELADIRQVRITIHNGTVAKSEWMMDAHVPHYAR